MESYVAIIMLGTLAACGGQAELLEVPTSAAKATETINLGSCPAPLHCQGEIVLTNQRMVAERIVALHSSCSCCRVTAPIPLPVTLKPSEGIGIHYAIDAPQIDGRYSYSIAAVGEDGQILHVAVIKGIVITAPHVFPPTLDMRPNSAASCALFLPENCGCPEVLAQPEWAHTEIRKETVGVWRVCCTSSDSCGGSGVIVLSCGVPAQEVRVPVTMLPKTSDGLGSPLMMARRPAHGTVTLRLPVGVVLEQCDLCDGVSVRVSGGMSVVEIGPQAQEGLHQAMARQEDGRPYKVVVVVQP